MPLNAAFDGSLGVGRIRSVFGPNIRTIAAIVTYDDPSETSNQYAHYQLKVNGQLQPGG